MKKKKWRFFRPLIYNKTTVNFHISPSFVSTIKEIIAHREMKLTPSSPVTHIPAHRVIVKGTNYTCCARAVLPGSNRKTPG